MKKNRFTESQILVILSQYAEGVKVNDICQKYGISTATLYNWKNKHEGVEVGQEQRIKELEEENNKLKRMYAEVCIQLDALKALSNKKR